MATSRYDWRQLVRIVWTVGWADFLLKYRGSFFGYLWSLALPAMKFLVIFHIFRSFVSDSIPHYPLYLLSGLIMWDYFSSVTNGCINMLRQKSTLIQRLTFPRITLIFAVGWTDSIIFLTHVLIFLVLAFMLQVPVHIFHPYTLLLLVQMAMLALGTGMLLSAYSLKFRDIEHLWTMVLQVLFWLTPIMYRYVLDSPLSRKAGAIAAGEGAPSTAWELLDTFITFQPLSILMRDARRVVLYPESMGIPTLFHAAVFTAFCAVVFAAGAFVFHHRSRHFLQEY